MESHSLSILGPYTDWVTHLCSDVPDASYINFLPALSEYTGYTITCLSQFLTLLSLSSLTMFCLLHPIASETKVHGLLFGHISEGCGEGRCTNTLATIKVSWLPKDRNLIQNQVFNESRVFLTSQGLRTLLLNMHHAVLHWPLWHIMSTMVPEAPQLGGDPVCSDCRVFHCTPQVSCSYRSLVM